MRLPAHPLWFWLILLSPILIWTALWVISQFGRISLKPLTPWLMVGMILSLPAFFMLDASDGHKVLRLAAEATFYTCWIGVTWIQRRYMFETLRGASAKWYAPWSSVRFSIPHNARVFVRDIDSVTPWYTDKLGLRSGVEGQQREAGVATYKFKEDGKAITLTTKPRFGTETPLILFTKRIGKMKSLLSGRGVDVGPIEQDRQGTRYFELHDPEGNAIEVVEEP